MTTTTSAPDPRRWWALFLLCTAQFLVILDTSIVGIAWPALQRSLGFDAAGLQWIFNAYVVAFGGLLLFGGRLSDLFGFSAAFYWCGHDRVRAAALATFTIRMPCALAENVATDRAAPTTTSNAASERGRSVLDTEGNRVSITRAA